LKPFTYFDFSRNIHFTVSNSECVGRSTVVVLAVKPHLYGEVLSALAADTPVSSDPLDIAFASGRLWISIMAGVTINDLRTAISAVDPECRVVRTIPNTTMKVRLVKYLLSITGTGISQFMLHKIVVTGTVSVCLINVCMAHYEEPYRTYIVPVQNCRYLGNFATGTGSGL
jgi:hypothetical protein